MGFQIGDRVRCHRWSGEGIVMRINKDVDYPVKVEVGNNIFMFTSDGKAYTAHAEPCLRHAETGCAVVVGEEPERKWKPTKPTWAWVPYCDTHILRVVSYDNGVYRDIYGVEQYEEAEKSDEIPNFWPSEWV